MKQSPLSLSLGFPHEINTKKMKLKQEVLNRLDNNRGVGLIMSTLGVAPTTARDYVKNNSENLTKAAMIKVIREEFGLTDDQILEEDKSVITK